MIDTVQDIVDLDRYPIADPDAPEAVSLAELLRQELDHNQYCALPWFVPPHVLEQMVGEVEALLPDAYPNRSRRNCYLQRQPDPTLPASHPRNRFFEASYRMLAYDLFAPGSLLRQLYTWDAFRSFVARLVGAKALYPSADTYQPLNVLCYGTGDQSAWHFDSTNAFTVTLMLQASEAGGDFEIAPNTRADAAMSGSEDMRRLKSVLAGKRNHVRTVPRQPGALVVFRGCTSVHRVTPVEGNRPRLMAVMVYEDKPGVTGDPEVNRTIYGPRAGTS